MRFTLTIDCDNAAFDPDPSLEVARLLKNIVYDMDEGRGDYSGSTSIRDRNGNKVGSFEFKQAKRRAKSAR
jgi:hypothetical protein